MEISEKVENALNKAITSNQDFKAARGEKVKATAFGEHIDACLDAIDITQGGDFGKFGLFDFSTTDKEDKSKTRITIAGLGTNGDDNRRLLVSVQDLTQDKQAPALLFVEYSKTDDGNKNINWTINPESLPKDKNTDELFANALFNAVAASTQKYVESLAETDKH